MHRALMIALEGLAIAAVLKLAIEQWSFVIGWSVEHVWRAIELATLGKVSGNIHGQALKNGLRRAGGFAWGKVRDGVSFSVGTIAQPFVEIARSWMPEPAEEESQLQPEQAKTAPTESQYRGALEKLKFRDSMPQSTALKQWALLQIVTGPQSSSDPEKFKELVAAWQIVCAKKGWSAN